MIVLSTSERPSHVARPAILAILPLCLLFAALAQLLFLLHWPMYVFGRWVPFLPAVAVAVVRMGVYSGLAWGLLRRDSTAWAGCLGELGRSVLLFLVSVWQHEGTLTGELFPAWWAQGIFSAALPVLMVLLTALDWGWRPGSELVSQVSLAARLGVALSVLAAVSLRGHAPRFGVRSARELRVFLTEGVPLLALLTLVEAAAWFVAGSR